MKLLSKTALALLFLTGAASPAWAQTVCHITATNVRASPGGPVIGWFDYETPIQVVNTAYPWLYVTSPYGEGWVWGRYVNPICLPDPCCIPCPTCGIVATAEPHYHYHEHYREHYHAAPAPHYGDKGDYHEPAPAPEYHEPAPAPAPNNCYESDAGCGHNGG